MFALSAINFLLLPVYVKQFIMLISGNSPNVISGNSQTFMEFTTPFPAIKFILSCALGISIFYEAVPKAMASYNFIARGVNPEM